MATSKNSVSLVIEAGVTGEEAIRRLATDIRSLAKDGGDAAPQFQALAAELDKLGSQAGAVANVKSLTAEVERLTAAQAQAAQAAQSVSTALAGATEKAAPLRAEQTRLREAIAANNEEIVKANNALRSLRNDYDADAKSTAKYASDKSGATQALNDAKLALVQNKNALNDLVPALSAAAAAETKLAGQYDALTTRSNEANVAVARRVQALQEAQAAALAAGISTTDLAAADQVLLQSTQRIAIETQQRVVAQQALVEVQKRQAETEAAIQKIGAAEAADQAAAAIQRQAAAVQSELLAIRESEQFTQKYVAAKAAAAAEALRFVNALEQEAAASDRANRAVAELNAQAQKTARDAEYIQAFASALDEADRAAAESAAAMKQLEQAAALADAEFNTLVKSISAAERAASQYAVATLEAGVAGREDVAAKNAQVQAAQRLLAEYAALTAAGVEVAQSRNVEIAALVAEAQAFLKVDQASAAVRASITETAVAARKSGQAINEAFGTVGIRSIAAIEAEIEQTSRAMSQLTVEANRTQVGLDGVARRVGTVGLDDLARAAGAAQVKIQRLNAEIQQIQSTPTQFEALNSSINDLVNRFGSLGAAIATVGFAVKPVIDATVALEQMRRGLETVTGSAEITAQQIQFVRDVAQQSGQAFVDTGKSYTKFAVSALESGLSLAEVDSVFKSVALAAGNLGLSTDESKRALEALGQIASKGTVQLEELKQQLGDALPGVLPKLAKELGITQKQLIDLATAGQLTAQEGIPAIGRALESLGPKTGTVDGIVASFNRFKNVVLEAGTIIVEGPLGRGAGVVLTAFAGVIRDIAFVATSASTGLTLLGQTIGATTAFAASGFRDLKTYQETLDGYAQAAATSITRFRDTAYGGAEATAALGVSVSAAGASFKDVELAAESAGKAVVAGAGAQAQAFTSVATAAQGAATATAAAGAAAAGAATANAGQSSSLAQLQVRFIEAGKAAEAQASAAQILAEGTNKAAESSKKYAALAQDETSARIEQARGAEQYAKALDKQVAADQAVVDIAKQGRAALIAYAGANAELQKSVESQVQAYDKLIQKKDADLQKTIQQSDAANVAAASLQLQAEQANDNSKRIVELSNNIGPLRDRVTELTLRLADGKATLRDVEIATLALGKAQGLLRDAYADAAANVARVQASYKADADLRRANINVLQAEAKARQAVAATIGDEQGVLKAQLEQKQNEIKLTQEASELKRADAQAVIAQLELQKQEILGTGDLEVQKRAELDIRIKVEQAKIRETESTPALIKSLDEERAAILRKINLNAQESSARVGQIQAQNNVTQASIAVQLSSAKATETAATAAGNETAAVKAQIEQKRLQIDASVAAAQAKFREAAETIALADKEQFELAISGRLTPQKELELSTRRENARAKQIEAQASNGVVAGLEAEIAALERRTAAVARSNNGNLSSAGSKSAAGGTYNNQGFATNADGSVTTAGYQVPVPAGYSYTLDPYAPGATPAGYDERGRKYPGFFVPTNPSRYTANPAGFTTAPGPTSPPSPSPAPAPSVSTPSSAPITVNLNLSNGQSFPVNLSDQASADALVAALRAATRAAGGTAA